MVSLSGQKTRIRIPRNDSPKSIGLLLGESIQLAPPRFSSVLQREVLVGHGDDRVGKRMIVDTGQVIIRMSKSY